MFFRDGTHGDFKRSIDHRLGALAGVLMIVSGILAACVEDDTTLPFQPSQALQDRIELANRIGRERIIQSVQGDDSRESNEGANTVISWNLYAERAIGQTAQERGQPELRVLATAMVQGAVYDAVNAIARTHQPHVVAPRAHGWFSKDAATATAAYRTLIALLPERQSMLDPLYAQSLLAIPDGIAKTGGIRVGDQAAEAMLAARENDGRNGPSRVVIGTEPGEWRPTPPDFAIDPASWMADVKPFLIPSPDWLRTRGPNALTSRAYAKELAEVREYGARFSQSRTREQTDIALFWDRAPWGDIVRSLAQSQELDLADAARLLAMVNLAGADATIACRNDKYYWNWWRPITAIQEPPTYGNPTATPDPSWMSLIDAPPYPDHPAGHTCGSGAIVGVLQNFFGTDRMAFSATSPSSGTTRSFRRFSQALQEVIDSRVWGGIHFRTAETQGAHLGKEVARWLRKYYGPWPRGNEARRRQRPRRGHQ